MNKGIAVEHVPGTYQGITLTGVSAAHEIDPAHKGEWAFCHTDALVHVRFGGSSVVATINDPPVLPAASATVADVAQLPKPKGATHVAVLAPGGSGSLKLWLGKGLQR